MTVAQVHQREIVEVPFTLPDGQILPHPALVLSCDDLQNVEPGCSMPYLSRQRTTIHN